jgi:DNA repair protein RecN (Recombination protein N)
LRTIDLLAFQLQELDRAQLEAGEDARLEAEKRLLANLEKVRAAASSAYGELYEEDGSAGSRLALVSRSLDELRRYDAAFDPYFEPLASARAALEDLALFLRDYLGKLEANPRRLEEIEDRLALVDRLKRKYGSTIEAMLAYRDEIRKRLSGLEHADERRGEVVSLLERVSAEYRDAALELSRLRREAGRKLAKQVREELAQVGMEKTRFEVHLEPLPEGQAGPKGLDQVEFFISPNPGEEMRPLEKIASGGELSRLMLGLKTVVGKARGRDHSAPGLTFVFDEVDAGIGGRVAESVGQRLKRLARDAQVLCVTHLAQIACFADHHFRVEKFERGGRTFTSVKYLGTEDERAEELARMLSGRQISGEVLKHAARMLRQAAK